MITTDALKLKPKEAIKHFKSKGFEVTWNWQEMLPAMHAKAFTVAKAMKMSILQDIRNMVQKSLDAGITFEQFRDELEPKLRAAGWWGKQLVPGPEGETIVQLGSPYRLRTIYQTNMQSSYMAGRWEAFQDNKDDRPYMEYIAVLDDSTRPAHRALNGIIKHIDDPFWNTFMPPNSWNCRCRTNALTAEQAEEKGITTGKAPKHPDPAFAGNPGKDQWEPDPQDFDPDIWKLGK